MRKETSSTETLAIDDCRKYDGVGGRTEWGPGDNGKKAMNKKTGEKVQEPQLRMDNKYTAYATMLRGTRWRNVRFYFITEAIISGGYIHSQSLRQPFCNNLHKSRK